MRFLDGKKARRIRAVTKVEEKDFLRRTDYSSMGKVIELENDPASATLQDVLNLLKGYEHPEQPLTLKDFMPAETIALILGTSAYKTEEALDVFEQRTSNYPLLGELSDDSGRLPDPLKLTGRELKTYPQVTYADFSDESAYAIALPDDPNIASFMRKSIIIISPKAALEDGNYCFANNTSTGKYYVQKVIIKDNYYILEPENGDDSILLRKNITTAHKIVGSIKY
jgi:hypothetical protein